MRRFKPLAAMLVPLAAIAAGSVPASGQCRLCAAPSTAVSANGGAADVTLEIESSIDFDRLVFSGGGSGTAMLNPDGSTSVAGAVAQVSRRAMVGSAVVRGEAGRAVRVELPSRIILTSTSGGQISFEDVVSDLPALPRLDSTGRLAFHFGGRLQMRGDAEGDYRGDLPITVEYL